MTVPKTGGGSHGQVKPGLVRRTGAEALVRNRAVVSALAVEEHK